MPKNKILIHFSENSIFDFDLFGGKKNTFFQIVVFIKIMQINVIFVLLGIQTTLTPVSLLWERLQRVAMRRVVSLSSGYFLREKKKLISFYPKNKSKIEFSEK